MRICQTLHSKQDQDCISDVQRKNVGSLDCRFSITPHASGLLAPVPALPLMHLVALPTSQ